ncbi:hypothetical protein ACH4GK_08440 [Streptomyces rimosus]|uniref:hypothetical protein n=1 Tax=Streptomyces rimosus TaxID=1927 RepID=UPI0004C9C30D|nr:hypothetical protein [Streptomyces rimosus]
MTMQPLDITEPQVVEADWTVLGDPQVESVVRAVARAFARDYGLTLEYEDAYREGVIIAAERPPTCGSSLPRAAPACCTAGSLSAFGTGG